MPVVAAASPEVVGVTEMPWEGVLGQLAHVEASPFLPVSVPCRTVNVTLIAFSPVSLNDRRSDVKRVAVLTQSVGLLEKENSAWSFLPLT